MLLLFVLKNLISPAESKAYMLPNTLHFLHMPAGKLCSDGLLCLPVMFFLRECTVFLGCCSWRTLQRWTAVPACYVFFCANARCFWGVAAGELCSDGLLCLPVIFFCANARSFWVVAAMNCLPFAFYNLAQV